MAMKERVLGLLRGPEASRIRFTDRTASGQATINRAAFAKVASAIDAGKIKVTPPDDPNEAAKYDGELRVPRIVGRIQESQVMHASTHAFFDLTKSPVEGYDVEAVSHIVGALYSRMTGLTPARWTGAEPFKAKSVADALLHQYAVGVAGIPVVNAPAWQDLWIAVMQNP